MDEFGEEVEDSRPGPGRGPRPPVMPPVSTSTTELLATWDAWSRTDVLNRELRRAIAKGDAGTVGELSNALAREAHVDPLAAIAANYELTRLLSGWRWHAVRAAHQAGASWAQIGQVDGDTSVDGAHADYIAYLDIPASTEVL